VCTECVQTRGSSHEGSDPGCISIPLAPVFGYVVGNIGSMYWRKLGAFRWLDHREQGDELWAMWLDRTFRQRERELLWTVGDENERKNA
jgi:hypothetical protein